MPEAIVDTSALIFLHQLGHLGLLQRFYRQVLVPPAVVAELAAGANSTPAPPLVSLDWVLVASPTRSLVAPSDLGSGELEVIALGLDRPGLTVILDDARARAYAQRFDLRVTGTLGVLARARREGHIIALAPELDRLASAGFRMTPELRRLLLSQGGEDP